MRKRRRSPIPVIVSDLSGTVIHVSSGTSVIGPGLGIRVHASHAAVCLDGGVPRGPRLGVEAVNPYGSRGVSVPAVTAAGFPIVSAPTPTAVVGPGLGIRFRASHAAVRPGAGGPPRPWRSGVTVSPRVPHGVGIPAVAVVSSPVEPVTTVG